jgi:hypothetical protein
MSKAIPIPTGMLGGSVCCTTSEHTRASRFRVKEIAPFELLRKDPIACCWLIISMT